MFNVEIYLIVALWFLFIIAFSGKEYRLHAIILCVGSAVSVLIAYSGFYDGMTYNEATGFLVCYDALLSLIMVNIIKRDLLAWKHVLLLAFATLCHTMILYDLTVGSTAFSDFFYTYYDELIFTVALLQMSVSKDGITTALRNVQTVLYQRDCDSDSYSQGYHSHYRSKG